MFVLGFRGYQSVFRVSLPVRVPKRIVAFRVDEVLQVIVLAHILQPMDHINKNEIDYIVS
jgi:hypothetical protein